MTFAQRQFAKAIEQIEASEAERARSDKRRASRIALRIPVVIKFDLDPKTKWTGARLHDISAHGARLEVPCEMAVGSSFLLQLPSKDGKQSPPPLHCRVVHCLTKSLSFMIGAEFVGSLSAEKSGGENTAEMNRIRHSILD